MDARRFISGNGVEHALKIISAPYPILGWCCVGNNFIHKHCDAAPTSFSNEDNSWSEEYAIDLVRSVDLKFLLEQVVAKAPKSGSYCQYYSPKEQKYFGYCDFYGDWYEWFDLGEEGHWSKLYMADQLAADRTRVSLIEQALKTS